MIVTIMSEQNPDLSHSKIVVMPRWHEDTQPAEIWLEAGVVHFRDMTNPENVLTATVYDFEERMDALAVFLEDDEIRAKMTCSRRDAERFLYEVRELIKEAKRQLHVGLPIETISEVERSRRPVHSRSGFDAPVFHSAIGDFAERESGLLIPAG
jgi:hypothetical protein